MKRPPEDLTKRLYGKAGSGKRRTKMSKTGLRRASGKVQGSQHTKHTNKRKRQRWAAYDAAEAIRLQEGRVDRLDRLMRFIANAEKRLAAAQRQYEAAEEAFADRTITKSEKQWLAELWAEVELRRSELEEYRRLLVSTPASAEHRGVKSYRPVPSQDRASGL